ncbi:hypothetical protein [Kaistia sp. MMO-174]|uniref:hypothetical protein n=1 Tax=Kaistia sp. MMO-174 TaxID=3081256 RepID=UPI00301ABDCB
MANDKEQAFSILRQLTEASRETRLTVMAGIGLDRHAAYAAVDFLDLKPAVASKPEGEATR